MGAFSMSDFDTYSPGKRDPPTPPSSAFTALAYLQQATESRSPASYPTPDCNASDKFTSEKNSTQDVDAEYKPKTKRVRRKTQRRREQCRANQARYRMKQVRHAVLLEMTVEKLRAEIPVLKLQRNRLLRGSKQISQQSIWSVVVEYFHVFRFGVLVTPKPSCPSMKGLGDNDMNRQLAFLRSTMSDDVILGELGGVDTLMEQWRRYSTSFQHLYFQLDRIQRSNEKFVTVSASLNVTITQTTLTTVFPHLSGPGRVQDGLENGVKRETAVTEILASKLLGQRLCLPCWLCFEWDVASCRVRRLETTVNFLKALLRVLGTLEDAAVVMEHALIAPDGALMVNAESNSS
ncbi:hypothetical protein PHYBOEH_010693 [Phytophthora boehmeriae]|uniref:BZIP domain-containing protein n=1 Tax=Phytophthora boehmeriae TaxID=109152 RepID=A0A8T1X0E4_9STRA|nr:hypothetical protein PHYBOEH_010693 [Phytophthora boehmeriae]